LIRRIICPVLKLALRIFFRRIEVGGLERVPKKSPVIFVLNHPNALVDPVFLLCLVPRRVSFLAKAPLFRMPVLGYLVRSLDSLPVYRKQDMADTARNRETFEQARELLARGGTLAICPEGTSHSEPRLKPLKTGAARIALGAASSGAALNLQIVPAGLYYTAKTTFRSSALLYFGEPIKVEPVELEPDGEPPHKRVRALSAEVERALREVVLNAEHEEALALIARAERIFSSAAESSGEKRLARELELRRRFVEGYALLQSRSPERLSALVARLTRFEEELKQVGLEADDLTVPKASGSEVVLNLLSRALLFALLSPVAVAGIVVHYPAYKLAGYVATKFSRDAEDVISTVKIIAAMLLFPLTWLPAAFLLFRFAGWPIALASLIVIPLAGYAAVRFFEKLDRFIGTLRALTFFVTRSRFFKKLLVERRAIREEILALGEEAARA